MKLAPLNTMQQFKDTYTKVKTTTLLRHSTKMTDREKTKVLKILKYIARQSEDSPFKDLILKSKSWKDVEEFYLKQDPKTKTVSDERIFVDAVTNFHVDPKSLLMITMSIHSRVKPNNCKDDWMDNFSLNNFLYQLSTVEWLNEENKNIDDDSLLVIPRPSEKLINKNVKIHNPTGLLSELGNKYRLWTEFVDNPKNKTVRDPLQRLDVLVEKYPYFTFCCHGCDVFSNGMLQINLKDVLEFTKRYPYTIVGGILNTKTYKSGKGEHWVAVMFLNQQCYLMCSFGTSFETLFKNDSKTAFLDVLNTLEFGRQCNGLKIQNDECNCGIYSVLFNLVALAQHNSDKINITEVVDAIGFDAENINENGIFDIKEIIVGWH